ncbi:MAG: GNAT family N-acetyltransferase [Ignavibacteriales bacterium]|nr:GNAT family N-acetyltransferase [Ignavibacteriales bacterium]
MSEYFISTDKSKLNVDVIHSFLTTSYWAQGIPRETVVRCIENSLCFGAYFNDEQVGFARVISDYTTFAYLADVFVIEAHRGKEVSKMIMGAVIKHPQLQGLRRIVLATKDAHGLYAQYGFTPLKVPERWMEIHNPNVYMEE